MYPWLGQIPVIGHNSIDANIGAPYLVQPWSMFLPLWALLDIVHGQTTTATTNVDDNDGLIIWPSPLRVIGIS